MQIATIVEYSIANSDWNSLALKPRAVSTRLNEMLRNPDDPVRAQLPLARSTPCLANSLLSHPERLCRGAMQAMDSASGHKPGLLL